MSEIAIKRLEFLCKTIPELLRRIDEKEFSFKPAPEKWSRKEILGHLIDSATNNHHRIVRGQSEYLPKITYSNEVWNPGNHYQELPIEHLISFWTVYNRHILEIIRRIPEERLLNQVITEEDGENTNKTIAFIIEDYVEHLEHHLRQLVSY